MSVVGAALYHVNVTVAGAAVLRLQRLALERRLSRPWRHPHLGPPLRSGALLKELISRHYLNGRFAHLHIKTAWVTSGAPVEPLVALGFHVHYPENHGAVCGIRRVAGELAAAAERNGYSADLCSYARTDFGTVLEGRTPVGRLPRPDVLLACTNICQTVLHWYQVLAHHYQVPLVLVDTPFVYEHAGEHALEYVRRQLETAVVELERVAGRSLAPARLEQVTARSREAAELWRRVLATARNRPAPFTAFDAFIHLAPIVEMRGQPFTVTYYRALLAELEQRVHDGVGAVANERKRLLWDNLPIWHRVRWLSELMAERGVALVASTYANAWAELAPMIDPSRPLESAARVYLHAHLNRGAGDKLARMEAMAREYAVDGFILHSDRSCKPYSVGQVGQRHHLVRTLGLPALLLEADHSDPRSFSEHETSDRLQPFLEQLGVAAGRSAVGTPGSIT